MKILEETKIFEWIFLFFQYRNLKNFQPDQKYVTKVFVFQKNVHFLLVISFRLTVYIFLMNFTHNTVYLGNFIVLYLLKRYVKCSLPFRIDNSNDK